MVWVGHRYVMKRTSLGARLNNWVWVFPGQGAQYVGMGRELLQSDSIARAVVEEAEDLLKQPLRKLWWEGSIEKLSETRNSQLAIFTLSTAMMKALVHHLPDAQPVAVAGLSLGEYSALVASERLSFRDGLLLVKERAEALHEACLRSQGRMVAMLGASSSEIARAVAALQRSDVVCANFNAPEQVVLSGSSDGVEAAIEACRHVGVRRTVPLSVQGAFHSPYMLPAAERLATNLGKLRFDTGRCPIALNVTGDWWEPSCSWQQLLVQQMVSPIRWESCVHTLTTLRPKGFLEIGPGQTLSALIKRITHGAAVCSLDGIGSWSALLRHVQEACISD